ncbi:hypothetical protein [Bradyrhizobium japonicum]|uniref:hypothetical protein n=1 Tax=Bradyrhizobium japonicum TaxID=375 RepID=UPI000419EFD3|nr:hypothetical protein [Bradyrhizobium japonicum]
MSQTTLITPDSHTKLPTTRDENAEAGWSFKRIVDSINEMFTELYGYETARVAVEAVESQIKFVDVTISSAELLALNATPKTIVAAPGAGLALVLVGAVAYKAAGTAYDGIASGEDLAIKYTDSSGTTLATIETTGFLDQTTAQTRAVEAYRAASGVNSFTPSNTPLVMHLLSGEIATGDSDLKLRVYYRTIPTTL